MIGGRAYHGHVMRLLALAFVLLACVARPAWPGDGDPTGLDLLERCHALTLIDEGQQEPDERMLRDYGYCLGFMVGFVSGFAARDAAGEAGRFCPPEEARIADYIAAVRSWLVENPHGLEQLAAAVVLQSLRWRFPCAAALREGQ